MNIVGRSYDLKAAYRQLFIEKSNRPFSYIAVHNPQTNRADIFGGIALPFGSVQSVYSFLRVAHSLWFLGTTQLMLPWTFFYDDFLCFSKESLAGNTHHAATLLFKLLGWNKKRAPKRQTFLTVCTVLASLLTCRELLNRL